MSGLFTMEVARNRKCIFGFVTHSLKKSCYGLSFEIGRTLLGNLHLVEGMRIVI